MTVYRDALRYRYMTTEKALAKTKILVFWEKHGLEAAQEAFGIKRRTLFDWKKKWNEGGKKPEALNEKSRAPQKRRKRIWHEDIIAEIKRQRWDHPNVGKEKLHPILRTFCAQKNIVCPKPKTIGRIIKDFGGLRRFPQKISHFGKIKVLKRAKKLRKPRDFKAAYPGHCVALDTIERPIQGSRRYVITFEDLFTRYAFAWATTSHASLAAKEFFELCLKAFPFPIDFVLTDNGSEFMKHFAEKLKELHVLHYHTYPKTPKMNAHVERFNRTIQEEFVDYHASDLLHVESFNRKLVDWLIWYNTERVHHAFRNTMTPVEFMLSLPVLPIHQTALECKNGWPHTSHCVL